MITDVEAALTTLLRTGWQARFFERVAASAQAQLEPASYVVLREVFEQPGGRLSDLAKSLRLDSSTISRHVQHLERTALISRCPADDDRRASLLSPTKQGVKVLEAYRAARHEAFTEVFAGWTTDQLSQLGDLLDRLTADLALYDASSP